MNNEEIFPKIQKNISDFLNEEEGNISRSKVIMVGSIMVILGAILADSIIASAKHGSHGSHGSQGSHGSHASSAHSSHISGESHSNHYSHESHASHASHVSSTHSSYTYDTDTSIHSGGTATHSSIINADGFELSLPLQPNNSPDINE